MSIMQRKYTPSKPHNDTLQNFILMLLMAGSHGLSFGGPVDHRTCQLDYPSADTATIICASMIGICNGSQLICLCPCRSPVSDAQRDLVSARWRNTWRMAATWVGPGLDIKRAHWLTAHAQSPRVKTVTSIHDPIVCWYSRMTCVTLAEWRAVQCLQIQVWLARCRYRVGIRHLKKCQHIVTVLFLWHSHGAILEILIHLAFKRLSHLSAVAQFQTLAELGEGFCVKLVIVSGYNGIVDTNCEYDFGCGTVGLFDFFHERHAICDEVFESVIFQPATN